MLAEVQALVPEFMQVWQPLVFGLLAIVIIWLVKIGRDALTPFDDNYEVMENKNFAVGVRRFGLFVGIALGMVGAGLGVPGWFVSQGLLMEIGGFVMQSAVAIGVLFFAVFFNDLFILRGIKNNDAVKNGNVAVGLVEAGSYLATGLILFGSFASGNGIIYAVAFAAMAQVALLVMSLLYEAFTPFKALEEIKNGNIAAGLGMGGMLLVLGILMRASVYGAASTWVVDVTLFLFYSVVMVFALMGFRWASDRLLLPGTSLATAITRDRNVAAVALNTGVLTAVAIVVSFAM